MNYDRLIESWLDKLETLERQRMTAPAGSTTERDIERDIRAVEDHLRRLRQVRNNCG